MATPVKFDQEQLFEIKALPGKGQGVIALTRITRGMRILAEKPLVKVVDHCRTWDDVETDLAAQVDALPEKQQLQYLSLYNNFADPNEPARFALVGIYQTNALPCEGDRMGGLFPTICRINHNCVPNAIFAWRGDLVMEVVHALRDIEVGEEITVAYDADDTSSIRGKHLKTHFGFACNCSLCCSSPKNIEQSDIRRQEMECLDATLDEQETDDPYKVLANCRNLIGLHLEEYGDAAAAGKIEPYRVAYEIARERLSDPVRAMIFAQRAFEARATCEGSDSPDCLEIKGMMEALPNQAEVDERPMDCESFEEWLWGKDQYLTEDTQLGQRING